MAKYKLYEDEDEELEKIDIQVIAIHTSLEDYRLAFFLNQQLEIQLSKNSKAIVVENKKGNELYSSYLFEDEKSNVYWSLIENKNEIISQKIKSNQDLFANSEVTFLKKIYFLPEFKKVDYLLKIEGAKGIFDLENIIHKINTINKIATVYEIEIDLLKSKII